MIVSLGQEIEETITTGFGKFLSDTIKKYRYEI